jgi:hypothetical protein
MNSCEKARDDIIKTTFNKRVECMSCDLASLQSIKQFVNELNESIFTFGKSQTRQQLSQN